MTSEDKARSRAEQFARKAAAHLAKGKAPAHSSDVVAYVETCADEVAVTLDCFVQCINAEKPENPIVLGYLFLIGGQLEHLRYRMDKGFADAIQRVENFQTEVASHIDAGRMGAAAVSMIGSALQHAGVAASRTLIAAVETCAPDAAADDPGADFVVALDEMAAECDSDPFALAGLLAEAGHAMPAEARAMMAMALAASLNPAAREAGVLQMLDPEPSVRQAAAKALLSRVSGLSPDSLRRLIAMRNWAPETERDAVDALIRAARANKIECAPWRAGEETEIVLASSIDGSGAQGFLIVTKAGRRKRLSSVLVRTAILDAWSGPPESKAKVRDALEQAAAGAAMAPVPRSYLNQVIGDRLSSSVATGRWPPPGLLQVAETLGGAEWRPEPVDWREVLGALLAEIPVAMRQPEAMRVILGASDDWAYVDGVATSWFEDDQQTATILGGGRKGKRAIGVERVMTDVIAPRRDKWARLFAATAQWLRETTDASNTPWREFAILADAVALGCDLGPIPLMQDIAERTLAALALKPQS